MRCSARMPISKPRLGFAGRLRDQGGLRSATRANRFSWEQATGGEITMAVSGRAALLDLAAAGQWAELSAAIKAAPPARQINHAGAEGLTPLHHAVLEEQLPIVRLLVRMQHLSRPPQPALDPPAPGPLPSPRNTQRSRRATAPRVRSARRGRRPLGRRPGRDDVPAHCRDALEPGAGGDPARESAGAGAGGSARHQRLHLAPSRRRPRDPLRRRRRQVRAAPGQGRSVPVGARRQGQDAHAVRDGRRGPRGAGEGAARGGGGGRARRARRGAARAQNRLGARERG